MASGLPVVATRVGGNVELVDNGRSGIVVPSADVEAMAQAMADLAHNPARAAALGAEGRREVERRFSLQAMVMAYRDLYDRQLAAARQNHRND